MCKYVRNSDYEHDVHLYKENSSCCFGAFRPGRGKTTYTKKVVDWKKKKKRDGCYNRLVKELEIEDELTYSDFL